MTVRALRAGKRTGAESAPGDRDAQRLLALLWNRALTVSALRDHGIGAPAQAVYALQLAGYTIDSVQTHHSNGDKSRRYRLRGAAEETQASRSFPSGANAMSSATDDSARRHAVIVCVQQSRGRWEVLPPGRRGRISCETLEDARRIAYLSVAHANDCELIVRDAHNRVLEHELIDGRRDTSSGSRARLPNTPSPQEVGSARGARPVGAFADLSERRARVDRMLEQFDGESVHARPRSTS